MPLRYLTIIIPLIICKGMLVIVSKYYLTPLLLQQFRILKLALSL